MPRPQHAMVMKARHDGASTNYCIRNPCCSLGDYGETIKNGVHGHERSHGATADGHILLAFLSCLRVQRNRRSRFCEEVDQADFSGIFSSLFLASRAQPCQRGSLVLTLPV